MSTLGKIGIFSGCYGKMGTPSVRRAHHIADYAEGICFRKYRITGSNQYITKYVIVKRRSSHPVKQVTFFILLIAAFIFTMSSRALDKSIITAVIAVDRSSVSLSPIAPTIPPSPTFTPTPTPSELESVVSYIVRVFEPEGKAIVLQALNCFYSESMWDPHAVNINNDPHQSTDYSIAQLNDYWHNLSEAEKVDFRANIDRAYQIYKARGNFSPWYGRLCAGVRG